MEDEAHQIATASELLKAGKTADGVAMLRPTVLMFPESRMAHLWLGYGLQRLQDLDGAIDHYEKAAQLDPRQMWPFLQGALIWFKLGDSATAVRILQQGLEFAEDRDSEDYHRAQGALAGATGRWADAERFYRLARAERPESDTFLYSALAQVIVQQKRFAVAKPLLEAVTGMGQATALDWHYLGFVQMRLGKFSEARLAAQEAIRRDRDNPEHWKLAAQIEMKSFHWMHAWKFVKMAYIKRPRTRRP